MNRIGGRPHRIHLACSRKKPVRRVADKALGGQVLVSERVHTLLAKDHPERFGEPTAVDLKGLAGSHRLYPVHWAC